MSKLIVEVCKIDKIEALENAQNLEMATIKGWNCLVGKGQHIENELVIFVPPDAMVPENVIEKLNLSYLRGNGRVRTVKLRGYISQGLVLPTTALNVIWPNRKFDIYEGQDYAISLGITKYTPVIKMEHRQKVTIKSLFLKYQAKELTLGEFLTKAIIITKQNLKRKRKGNPNFKEFTDMDNIKHYPTEFLEGEMVVITEKIHGTNFRAGTLPLPDSLIGNIISFFTGKKYEFVYGSHHVQKTALSGKGYYGEDVYGQIAERYKLKDLIPEDYCIYGEIYGPTIQELAYGAKRLEVVFFDVKYQDKYLSYHEAMKFLEDYGLPTVPLLYKGLFSQERLKLCTDGNSTLEDAHHIREGCVVKSLTEVNSPKIGRKALKSISAAYLLTKKQEKPDEAIDDNAEYVH